MPYLTENFNYKSEITLLGDHLGSTSVAVNLSGTKTGATRYKPFGEERSPEGAGVASSYRYTGQLALEDGIAHYGARAYDAYLNQWIQPDTIVPDQNNPLDWNRYSYTRYNPVRYTDPNCHMVSDGCNYEGCSLSEGEEHRDYVYNVLHNNNERQVNTEKVESGMTVLEIIGSIVFEPVDWVVTAKDCLTGSCSPFAFLGVLPMVPGSKIDDIADAVKKMDGVTLPVDDALDLAIDFLGKGYSDMGKGRFVSADSLRQVRMGTEDILGSHPFSNGPHINFEVLAPKVNVPGRFTVIQNIHIFLMEVFE